MTTKKQTDDFSPRPAEFSHARKNKFSFLSLVSTLFRPEEKKFPSENIIYSPPKLTKDNNKYYLPGRFSGYTYKRLKKIKNFFAYSWTDKRGNGIKS